MTSEVEPPSRAGTYLLQFVHEDEKAFGRFRFEELDSVCELILGKYGVEITGDRTNYDPASPFWKISLPADGVARRIGERLILLKDLSALVVDATTEDEVVDQLRAIRPSLAPYFETNASWRFDIDAFGKKLSRHEQERIRQRFLAEMPFKGPIVMDSPDHTFRLFYEYRTPRKGGPRENPLLHVYLVREICRGKRNGLLSAYSLQRRKYIGPTSTLAELAFLMANQALAAPGKVVLDPFVGTGSLLIAAAYFGARTVGSDLDYRVLHGFKANEKGDTILDNFKQYGLPPPELVCSDNSIPVWRPDLRFDAMVCDPPYGVRAGARKTGRANGPPRDIPEHFVDSHVPTSQPYDVAEVMDDLMDLAARFLTVNGRLVYLLPSTEDFKVDQLPKHPCLKLHALSEQVLRAGFSRHCVTMTKTREISDDEEMLDAALSNSIVYPKTGKRRAEQALLRASKSAVPSAHTM